MGTTGFVFILAYSAGCLLALARHPIFGLLTYVSVFYLHPPSRWWGQAMGDVRWALVAALVTLVAHFFHKRPHVSHVQLANSKFFLGLVIFVLWLALQMFWVLDLDLHLQLLELYAKYVLMVFLICKCIDTEQHLKWFLWTHVLGCFYLGWLAFSTHAGGRFEEFGGPGINEANAGALQVATGVAAAASLILAGRIWERLSLIGILPFILNALILTASRSGFLSLAFAGLVFNLFTPARFRWVVRALSVLGVLLFVILANDFFWERIGTLKHHGEEIEGVDTSAGRLVLIQAQIRMFEAHPLGCGHRCTAVLSPSYLDTKYLTGHGDSLARSSHNTFMSLLVEQGVPGAVFYFMMCAWILTTARKLYKRYRVESGFLPIVFPGVVAALGAILVGDMFVDHVKSEARLWFISLLIVMAHWQAMTITADDQNPHSDGGGGDGRESR